MQQSNQIISDGCHGLSEFLWVKSMKFVPKKRAKFNNLSFNRKPREG
jgi:hypothetical protein